MRRAGGGGFGGSAATPGHGSPPPHPAPFPSPPLPSLHNTTAWAQEEIAAIERGEADRENNLLTRAPHAADVVLGEAWDRPYSRSAAAYPAPWVRAAKFWPTTSRVDNVYGDRHLQLRLPGGDAPAADAAAADQAPQAATA